MATKGFKIKIGTSNPKQMSRTASAESTTRPQSIPQLTDQAKISEKLKNDEPLINFRRSFEELKTEVQDLFSDFQSFVLKEVFCKYLGHYQSRGSRHASKRIA